MTDLKKLFNDLIVGPEDLTYCVWYIEDDMLIYNEEGSVENLMNGEGYTTLSYIKGDKIRENFVFFELKSEYGESYQAVFDINKKITP